MAAHPAQQYLGAVPPYCPGTDGHHMPGPGADHPGLCGPPGADGPGDMGGGSALANVELWVQQQNATLQEGPFSPSFGPTGAGSQPPGMPPVHRARSDADVGLPPRCCPGPHHPGAGAGAGEFGPGPDSMFGAQPPPGYALDHHQHMMRSMAGARVPDENLTPEQLQRREEQLAQLQKIKQMLFPEKQGAGPGGFDGGPPPRYAGCPPPGMYRGPGPPGPDDMPPPHHHMMGQPPPPGCMNRCGGPGGMMVPGGMMDPQSVPPDAMLMMGGMGPAGFGEPTGVPPNWDVMTPEEREWFRLQQEYYLEQRQKRQIQLQQMAATGGQQPPPPPPGFFGEMPRQPPGRTSGPLSPVSPSFNGPSPNDPQGYFFPGQPGVNFPPGRPPNFPPNGPGGPPPPPNFNPEFAHHPDAGGGGFAPYGNAMMMPEPGPFPGGRFAPMCPASKPKRKRGNAAACVPCPGDRPGDDIFRHLQPAPSPQQFCSLNLFDGQELTITKQLNLAYQEPMTSSSPSTHALSSTPPTTAAAPPSRKKKKSSNDVRVKSEMCDVGVASPAAGPTASESGGDLSSDRPAVSPSVSSSGGRSGGGGGGGPITSATLASLARGVESLQDRIQADMLRGGPFGAVQMPEPDEIGDGDERRTAAGGVPTDPTRNQRLSAEGLPLQNADAAPTSDQSPMSGGGAVKQDPSSSSALLSPQPAAAPSDSSIPTASSGRMLASTSGGMASVQSPGGMVGNASVQIEPRAPNTIQYLPTRQHSSSDLTDPAAATDRCSLPPPEGVDVFRQVGPGQFCPNGPGMIPPGYDGPVPPGYNGPMGRFEPVYSEPLSPGVMASRGCAPVQFPGGEVMFPDGGPGGPIPYSDGPMMHASAGPVPYHGGRPMFYRGGGPVPPQGGPVYRPGQPPGMMVLPEFREGGPDRHGALMPMAGMPRPGAQMVMMGPGRPILPPEQPPMPPNPAPARSRTESRSKKSKESKRRAEAAAAARQNTAMCEDPAAMMAGRVPPDQRGPPGPYGGPGSMPGGPPGMGFPPADGPGGIVVDRMRPGPMMMGPDGSPGMMRHPGGGDVMMMSPEEFEMLRSGGGPPGMMAGDGRILVHRGGGGGMRSDQGMMMMMTGKGGMRPVDGDMMPTGPQMMMQLGPHEMEMRGDPGGGMIPAGEMRLGPGMMSMNEMRGGPGMIGPNDMRPGPGGMMGLREMRPGSGMMIPGELRPGSAAMPPSEGRPGSGMMVSGDMNPSSVPTNDPHHGMAVMSPRDDVGAVEGSKVGGRQGNGKGSVAQSSDGSRPESVGKRSEAELMQISADAAMRMGQMPPAVGGPGRPGSKLQSAEAELRPNSVAGMELMDGGMRPGSAAMMGACDARGRPGAEMVMAGDGSMRPGSALMMGIGPGDGGGVMRPRSEAVMDPMEMGMRPGSEMMMADGLRLGGGGPVMMQGMNSIEADMRPGADMMAMSVGDGRLRPGSAAMMAAMGPSSTDGGVGMMPLQPGDPAAMMMMGPGGEAMMAMNAADFDPRGGGGGCPPELLGAAGRMGAAARMLSPADGAAMRYDGPAMMPVRMGRPRAELDFRMMGGMEPPGVRGGGGLQYAPAGMRNGGVYPPDRQSMMMVMGPGGGGPSAAGGGGAPMPPNDFGGPGMGAMGPSDGAQFQQFQQQLYATKAHHHHHHAPPPPQHQGPASPTMMMMMESRAAAAAGNFAGAFDPIQNGPPPPVRFGPPPGM